MSKLESEILVIEDHLKSHEKYASTRASRLKKDGQATSFHNQTTQHVYEILEREKRGLHLKLINMKE